MLMPPDFPQIGLQNNKIVSLQFEYFTILV